MAGATIDPARKLGVNVCLEGVENQQLRDFVLCYPTGCHQGFYYAHPQSIGIFLRYPEENRAAHPDHAEWPQKKAPAAAGAFFVSFTDHCKNAVS